MNRFDLKVSKYILIILVVCITFALVVMQAYTYLPDENENNPFPNEYEENIDRNNKTNYTQNDERQNEITRKENSNEDNQYSEEEKNRFKENLPNIDKSSVENIENTNSIEKQLKFARELKSQASYREAMSIYKEVYETCDDIKIKGYSLEQIATIHAIEKRYGTALSYAQKAYNTYPNTQKEVLLARLYYKTGDEEKAKTRLEYILKRDFDQDR